MNSKKQLMVFVMGAAVLLTLATSLIVAAHYWEMLSGIWLIAIVGLLLPDWVSLWGSKWYAAEDEDRRVKVTALVVAFVMAVTMTLNAGAVLAVKYEDGKLKEVAERKDKAAQATEQTKQTGNIVTGPGQVQPTFSGSIQQTVFLTPQQTAQMNELGLQFSDNQNGTTGNGVQVQATDKTPDFVKKVLGPNGVTNMYSVNNNLQFVAEKKSGPGQDVYTLVKNGSGMALMGTSDKTDPLGNHPQEIIGSTPGFNVLGNNRAAPHTSFIDRLLNSVGNSASGMFNLFGGHASAQELINSGTATQFQIAQANAKAAAAMLAFRPPPLPTILPAPIAAPKPISIAPPTAPQTQSISQAAPVKSPALSPQNPGGINLQGGGGFRLQ